MGSGLASCFIPGLGMSFCTTRPWHMAVDGVDLEHSPALLQANYDLNHVSLYFVKAEPITR